MDELVASLLPGVRFRAIRRVQVERVLGVRRGSRFGALGWSPTIAGIVGGIGMVGGLIAGVLTRLAAVAGVLTRLAADQMKRVYAELGGNDATIVCADADLDKAAEAIVLGRLARGNGQICCSVKRVFVQASVCDELARKLSDWCARLVVGDQMLETTDVGPLINEQAAIKVCGLIERAMTD